MIALLKERWSGAPVFVQAAVGLVVRIEHVVMMRETRVEGDAEFWKIFANPVELTYKPKESAQVAALDFVLTVSLFAPSPSSGLSSFGVHETHMSSLFKEDHPGFIHYLRAPLRLQGPGHERGGLLFVLDPFLLQAVGGRENIDHNNCTLQITDHITGRSMSVVASQFDWQSMGGPPKRSPQG